MVNTDSPHQNVTAGRAQASERAAGPVQRRGPLTPSTVPKQPRCPLPPPNDPQWSILVPTPPAVGGEQATPDWTQRGSMTLSPSGSPASSLVSLSSLTASVEEEPDLTYRPGWLDEISGVLELPVSDWRSGDHTQLCVAGVDMHIAIHASEKIDPEEFLHPPYVAGRPLDLKTLAEFSVLRSNYELSLAYEEHAAIRAADAAALFRTNSPNIRDPGGLHRFFLPLEVMRALVYQWRTADALAANTLKDRQTDSITLMLSVRPEFEGLVLDGDMLDVTVYLSEPLLGEDGRPLPRYAAAITNIVDTFRHKIGVLHAHNFVRRLQQSGRVDFPKLARPLLSAAAAARLTGKDEAPPSRCQACAAFKSSSEPAMPMGPTAQRPRQVPTPKQRVIPRLPGALMAQLWGPAMSAQIVEALIGAGDSDDAMFAAVRSLGACGHHTVKILDAAYDDLKNKIPLTA